MRGEILLHEDSKVIMLLQCGIIKQKKKNNNKSSLPATSLISRDPGITLKENRSLVGLYGNYMGCEVYPERFGLHCWFSDFYYFLRIPF